MTLHLTFGANTAAISDKGTVITLPDGASIPGEPQDTLAYRRCAKRYGYGADTLKMCQDHDPTHAALAYFLGLPESPTLRGVARLGEGDRKLYREEEAAVLAIQKFARAAGIDPIARYKALTGHCW